jgi:hypothetical protein
MKTKIKIGNYLKNNNILFIFFVSILITFVSQVSHREFNKNFNKLICWILEPPVNSTEENESGEQFYETWDRNTPEDPGYLGCVFGTQIYNREEGLYCICTDSGWHCRSR